jgi:glycosyltransferase involved in cell wall biosynthesis
MKIALLCISAAWGGLEMNVYRFAVRLRERGHEVTLLARTGTPVYEKARQDGLIVVPFEVRVKYADIKAASRLASLLRARRIESLIISVAKDNYVAGWAKLFFYPRLKLYYQQHMQLGVPKKGLVQTLLYRSLTAWIAPLELLARQVREKTRMPPGRIHVIPLGIDLKQFEGIEEKRQKARSFYGLPADAFVAGIVGRLHPDKGQHHLLKAAGHLHRTGKPLHVLIVGEETRGSTGGYTAFLKQTAGEQSIEKLVHFHPYTEETALAFAALDVFVMASLGETYGMVTIEAMAAGLPVIGTNTGGTPELLGEGRYGMLIPPGDEKALAGALENMMNDPGRKQLGQAAQQYAHRTFGHHLQCKAMEELLTGSLSTGV